MSAESRGAVRRSLCDKLCRMSIRSMRLFKEELMAERQYWVEREESLLRRKGQYLVVLNKRVGQCDQMLESLGAVLDMMDDFMAQGDYDIVDGDYGCYDNVTHQFYKFPEVRDKYEWWRDKKRDIQLKILDYDRTMEVKIGECQYSIDELNRKLATVYEFLQDERPAEAGIDISDSEVPF